MKKAILTLLTAGLFSAAYAQDKALLYEVSGKNLAQPSYLYGTFHLVCPTDLQLTGGTRKALTAAKQLYLEIDFDDPALQTTMMKAMMLGDGKNLRDFLKPDDYTALDSYLRQNLGAGLAQMGTLRPIALLSVMYVSILECQPASYDLTFAQLAGQDKKEVFGLETIEQQMALLDRVPLDEQLKGLVDIARKPDEARKELTNLLAAYKAQDVALLMKLMHDSKFDRETEGFEQELLDKRNKNWIPVIEKAAREKSTFFAFGAGHLGGTNGVVSLMRQKGYSVKAVP
jgi:hypothetical protein